MEAASGDHSFGEFCCEKEARRRRNLRSILLSFLFFNRRSVDKNVAIERQQLKLQRRELDEAILSVGSKCSRAVRTQ